MRCLPRGRIELLVRFALAVRVERLVIQVVGIRAAGLFFPPALPCKGRKLGRQVGVIVVILNGKCSVIEYELAHGGVVAVRKRGDIAACDAENVRKQRADRHAVADNSDSLTVVFCRYFGNGRNYALGAFGKGLSPRSAPLRRIIVEIVHLHRIKFIHIAEAHTLAHAEVYLPQALGELHLKRVILRYRACRRHRAAQIA